MLAELRAQLVDLLDCWLVQHSTVGNVASAVFVLKPDGTWCICYYYRGLNAISLPAMELLHWHHIDALLDHGGGTSAQ